MFVIRQALKCSRDVNNVIPATRTISSKGPLVGLTVDNDGIAVMTLQRPPVNSLNLDLLKDISNSLDEVAKNKSRGMILTSASPTVFSAGLDIMEMYKPDLKKAEEFWSTLQDVWMKLFGSSYATAAAINGHSPAGGCLLAMSCEWRAMVTGNYTIGLNETALGIVAPPWFVDTMCNTISQREAEYALTTGRLFTVEEALKVGLIDETATDKSDAITKCKAFLKKYEKIPPLARSLTKQRVRSAAIQRLQASRQADIEEFLQFLQHPMIEKSLEVYIQALKKKTATSK